MLIIANTFTRPSKSVPFFAMPEDIRAQFLQNYRSTGKSPATTTEMSTDGLTAFVTTTWATRAAFDEFKADPMSETLRSLRTAYLIETGIQLNEDKQFVPSIGDEGAEPPAQG